MDNNSVMVASLYSLDGKLMVCKNMGISQKGYNRIELGEMFQTLSSGIYLLVIQTGGKASVTKAIKQ